jgi:ketosteroid isomerase-like protein
MSASDDAAFRYPHDLEALRNLGQRYSRAIDARDYDAIAALFHSDAIVDGLRGHAPIDEYLEGLRSTPRAYDHGMHLLGEPLIRFEPGSDTAELDAYAVVYQLGLHREDGGNVTLGMRYLDSVERRDGEWRISHRRTELLWML